MGFHRRRSRKLGLALGGGGARGGAHIGVLKVLEEEGIPIECVAGTSIGAVIGALYAISLSAKEVEKRMYQYLESGVFFKTKLLMAENLDRKPGLDLVHRISFFFKKEFMLALASARPFLIARDAFRESLASLFDDDQIRIEDTLIPFAAVATDLETGEEVILREGSLIDALYASCTYPGMVESVRLGPRLLVDGALSAMVPVGAARLLGSETVLAVDLEPALQASFEGRSAVDVMLRAERILLARLIRYEVREADIVIRPRSGDTRWYDLAKTPVYIPIGEKAARENVVEISRILHEGSLSRLFGSVRSRLR